MKGISKKHVYGYLSFCWSTFSEPFEMIMHCFYHENNKIIFNSEKIPKTDASWERMDSEPLDL